MTTPPSSRTPRSADAFGQRAHRRRVLASRLRERVATGLWLVPLLATTVAAATALAVVALDRALQRHDVRGWAFSGGPDSSQQILTMISTAVLGFMGLVFSITIVALQLASSQFSPRVLRTFLRDQATKLVLGIFVGTFVYTLVVLASIRTGAAGHAPFVPGYAVSLSFGLVLLTVVAFVYFVHHIAHAIRVVSIIESVAHEARGALEHLYPRGEPQPPAAEAPAALAPVTRVVTAARAGVVVGYDPVELIRLAAGIGGVISLVPEVGDYVCTGAPLLHLHGGNGRENDPPDREFTRAVGIGIERTMEQDVAFGFRQLVDIAEKALSPAVNDPTTAVQSLDRIHDLLRQLATRPLPDGRLQSRSGELRLVVPSATWGDYVVLAFSEIRQYGTHSLQIARRLRAAIDDLSAAAPPWRQAPLTQQRALLDAEIAQAWPNRTEREQASEADAGGLVSADD